MPRKWRGIAGRTADNFPPIKLPEHLAHLAAGAAKPAKYRNTKDREPCPRCGYKHDSGKEHRRCLGLHAAELLGEISELRSQVGFILHGEDGKPLLIKSRGYPNGRRVKIVVDFTYRRADGQLVAEEVKSPATRTPAYKIKRAAFERQFPEWTFLES